MAALFTGDDKRNFYAEDDYRAYLISRNQPPIVHHSATVHWKRLRAHTRRAVNLVDFILHRMVEALARSKTRRVQRELQLRGIRYPQETHDERSSPR
ncbi:MAG: hypothetical protein ACRCV5_00445 [Afipia sp.]